jgi:hypothetical protein
MGHSGFYRPPAILMLRLSAAFHKYGDAPRAARRDASPAECHRIYESQHLALSPSARVIPE